MTQQDFDRRFDRIIKAGLALILTGITLALLVGLPFAAFADDFRPFFVSAMVAIAGGFVCVLEFAHDIYCNPRWKR